MQELKSKYTMFAYLIYAAGAATIITAAVLSSPYLVLISALLILAAVAYMNSGHLINNMLLQKSRIVEVSKGYRLNQNLCALVKRDESGYAAIAAAILRTNERVINQKELFNELIGKAKIPFEFSISMLPINRKKVIEGLQTKLQMKEITLTNSNKADYRIINSLKREIEILQGDIDSISEGDFPVEVVTRLKTFSSGSTEGEASTIASKQIEQLCMMFSSAFNLSYTIITGEDLLELS
jgi:hypothetical protein